MAGPKPSASPSAMTRSRLAIIQTNINYMLRRLLDMDEHYIRAVSEGVKKQYIRQVGVLGLTAQNECLVRLSVDVNWDGFNRRMKEGRTTVRVKNNNDECSPELRAGIDTFKDQCSERALRIGWTLVYSNGLDKTDVDRELGIIWGTPFSLPNSNSESETLYIEEVPEASVQIQIYD